MDYFGGSKSAKRPGRSQFTRFPSKSARHVVIIEPFLYDRVAGVCILGIILILFLLYWITNK